MSQNGMRYHLLPPLLFLLLPAAVLLIKHWSQAPQSPSSGQQHRGCALLFVEKRFKRPRPHRPVVRFFNGKCR
uniref:Secreted peptide n=1 Tax=Anopheles braziliensis TaxID=58242 RepID=A0A2M3ZLC0_9DIPT